MKTTRPGFLQRLAAGCLLLAAALGAHAQPLDKPLLLIAAPAQHGFYSEAVLVVVPTPEGHAGFMINGATHTTVASAFPGEPDMAKVIDPIYLVRPHEAQPGATVDRVIRQWPGEARFFAGFAAWEPGRAGAGDPRRGVARRRAAGRADLQPAARRDVAPAPAQDQQHPIAD